MHAHVDIAVHMYTCIYICICVYIYVCMHNMHMLNKIIIQVSRNVQILMRETFIYMTMDAEHHETNPTIPFHLSHEDSEIHITHISKNMRKYASQNLVLEMFIYIKMDAESNETTPAISFPRFYEDSEMLTKNNIKKVSSQAEIVKLDKKQGQIWKQRPLKRWRPL